MEDILQNVIMGDLLAIYGRLLTKNQYRLLDLHYNQDYSLAEIAEQEKISRQAVHDTLKRGASSLNTFEEQLRILEKQRKIEEYTEMIQATISRWELSEKAQQERLQLIQILQHMNEESEEEADGI